MFMLLQASLNGQSSPAADFIKEGKGIAKSLKTDRVTTLGLIIVCDELILTSFQESPQSHQLSMLDVILQDLKSVERPINSS